MELDYHASRLPVEVVIHLMEFLSYSDRVAASQTCQLWYEASLHPKFLNQEKVVVKRYAPEYISAFKTPSKPYPHLILIEVEISRKMKDFWMKIASDLKSLYLENCDMCEKMFIDMLSCCRNLESLALDNCRELFMPGRLLGVPMDVHRLQNAFSGLKELNLTSNRYLSDSLVNRLVKLIPNLETISLDGCQISYHIGLFNKYYPERLTAENPDFASDTVLTFKNFYKIVEKHAKSIRVINLSRTLVDSHALCSIAELEGLRLDELHVTRCEQLTNSGIISLARHQHAVTVLDISYCVRVTDQALLNVCAGLPSLRHLSVRNCRAITDLGIVQLRRLEHLRELDISMCEQVTGQGIEEGFCSQVNKRFRHLLMEGLATITSGTVVNLAKKLPGLTHFSLSYCFNAVTDESVQAIFCNQRRLQSLRLAGCELVTDAGLTGLGAGLAADDTVVHSVPPEAPRRLHISLRSRAEQEIVRDAERKQTVRRLCEVPQATVQGYSLAQLTGLQELDLRCCNKITDVSLKYAFHLLELQHLNLSQCQQITEEGLREVGAHCPSIDTLSLGQCYNVTDDGIVAVTETLKRLKYLDIKGCSQLTGASVEAIVQHCRQLRYLDASGCNKMATAVTTQRSRLPAQTLYSQTEPCPNPPAPPLMRR